MGVFWTERIRFQVTKGNNTRNMGAKITQYTVFLSTCWLFFMFQDDKVSKDEWVQMWSDCLQSVKHGKPFPEWQQRFMQFMFEVNDKSGT